MSDLVCIPWRRPEEGSSDARKTIQPTEKPGLHQDLTTGSHPEELNTLLHCSRSVLAAGPFMVAVAKLMAVFGGLLADTHEAEPAAINMLIAAMYEEGPAAIAMMLAAVDEVDTVAHLGPTGEMYPPGEAYWHASKSSLTTTRQTRMNEFPPGMIQRLMPLGGTIYFGMDMASFTRGKIDPGVTYHIRDAAIKAAEDFKGQDLGIAFAYDPSRKVFSIRYDPDLDPRTLADAFFPSDSPDKWHVRVSSLADNRCVFEDNRDSLHKIFCHEFAHILGLRHYDAGTNSNELQEPSALWLGTQDGARNTIMRTGVHSSQLRLSEEDFWAIRDFYSKENGALMGGVRIVDVDPYERLLDLFSRRLKVLFRPQKR